MNWGKKAILRQYLTACCASLSGICAGSSYMWVTPLLLWFTSPESEIKMTRLESSWVLNAIEVGDFVTPIPAGILMDKLGRKPLLLSVGPTLVITWIVIYYTRSVIVLYIIRFVQGMAVGIVYSVLPIYLGEIAGPKIRGTIGILVQTMWYFGIVYTFIIGTFLTYEGIALVSLAVPIIFFFLFIWFPESPYYLVMKGEEKEAEKVLSWLRASDNVDEGEDGGGGMNVARRAVLEELEEMKASNEEDKRTKASWKDLLGTMEGRKALLLVEAVIIASLMGGLVTMLTYSSTTFADLSGGSLDPDTCTILVGVLLLLLVPLTGLFLDSFGRRPVLLASTAACVVALTIAAVYSYLDKFSDIDVRSQVWLFYTSIALYLIIIACGVEAVFPVLQGELFPNSTRAFASALICLSLTLFSLLSLVLFQTITEYGAMYMNFIVFAFFCLFGFIAVYFYLPETKGKTFVEIQKILQTKR